jgi:hypothetical protein
MGANPLFSNLNSSERRVMAQVGSIAPPGSVGNGRVATI